MIAKPPYVGAVGRRLGAHGRRLLVSTTVLTHAALLVAAPAQADDYVWAGGSGTGYATPANWNLNTAFPGNLAADTATFGNTAAATETVTLAGPATLAGWTFNTTAATSYTVDGGQAVTLSGGILNTSTGGTHTIANSIAGTGGIVQDGAGSTLVLSGANTYTGATTVSAGTLRTSADNVLSSSSALTISAGGTLAIGSTAQTVASLAGAGTFNSGTGLAFTFGADNTSTSFSGNVIGSMWMKKVGTGTFSFSGTGTVSVFSPFEVFGGTLAMVGTGSLAGASLNVHSGATFDISASLDGASFGFVLSDAGSTIHLGSKTLTIENSVTGISTTIQGGIDGSGGLTLGQKSNLSLTGVSTYTGPTTLTTATSQLHINSANAIATSSEVNVAASGATFDISGASSDVSVRALRGVAGSFVTVFNNNLVITNASSDFAGIIKRAFGVVTGGLILNGGHQTLSGVNTYLGATTVNAGTLSVNGSTATSSLTTVNAGGTLGGNGTVGSTAIAGGALAPGNSIGLLTVNGNLSFTAASSYMVEVSPTNADRTNVSGVATLGSATVNATFAAGSYVAKQYTILNAAGGLGGSTFGSVVNTNLPSGFLSSLSYDANNAYLNLALDLGPKFGGGLNANQQNVANTLTGYFNRAGGIPLVFGSLTPNGLTQVSGEAATGTQQTSFDAMNLFMGVMTDPSLDGRGDTSTASGASHYTEAGTGRGSGRDAYAMITKAGAPIPFTHRWSVWAAGYGGSQTTSGSAGLGSNTATSRIYGTAVGADYRVSPNTLAGFALAGGGTNFSVNGFGSGRSDLFQAGAFLRHTVGPAYLSAALAYGWQDVTTDRTVTVAGIDRLRAQFNANAWSGRAESGYRFATPLIGVTPYAAGQFTTFELPAYAESVVSGANTFALAYGAKTVTASRSELGLRTDKSFAMSDAVLTLRGRAAWAHDFNSDRSVAATFQTLPGTGFTVNGAAQSADKALTTASAELKWMSGFSLAATFEGEFAGNVSSYAGKGVAKYIW